MKDEPLKIGVVGCGEVSGAYLGPAKRFPVLEIVACADRHLDRAQAKAKEFGIPIACGVEELLANPEIEIVLNLTTPPGHYPIAKSALQADTHVYNEKPFTSTCKEGRELLELAQVKDLRIGGAPDTFLGAALQTARKLIDDGEIGEPVGATANMLSHGPESWYHNPELSYRQGRGPMFDYGPYYLTALISLLGPVQRVCGLTRKSFDKRLITSEPKRGTWFQVDVPTHVVGMMDFANGAIGTITTTFDVWGADLCAIEIFGSTGSLRLPDPNIFGGTVKLFKASGAWEEVPLTHGYDKQSRSLGLADMAQAIRTGRAHRASGEMAYHVLDIMHAIHDASQESRYIDLASTCQQPAALPVGLQDGELD
jgi:predicted dehydrogenase